MKLRNKINGGTVEVSEEYAERLVRTGEYEKVSTRKPAKKNEAEAKED